MCSDTALRVGQMVTWFSVDLSPVPQAVPIVNFLESDVVAPMAAVLLIHLCSLMTIGSLKWVKDKVFATNEETTGGRRGVGWVWSHNFRRMRRLAKATHEPSSSLLTIQFVVVQVTSWNSPDGRNIASPLCIVVFQMVTRLNKGYFLSSTCHNGRSSWFSRQ